MSTDAGSLSARERILGRLRAAAPSAAAAPTLPSVAPWFDRYRPAEPSAQRVAQLRAGLEGMRAEVHDTTEADWPLLLLRIAARKGLRKLLIGARTPHGAQLQAHATDELALMPYEQPMEHWRDQLFDTVDASLTRARSGIADIGALVLWPDASEPRLMSLVPPVHFVLLDAGRIHANLHAAMTAERWAEAMPTNVVLVSGPSKTADIQQTLAYGAHGPRELVVLLCHATGAAS